MKRLFVLRHAKSSWDHPGLSDFERPLNKRGKRTAPFMGRLMLERDWRPEFVLSSSAERAKQTAMLISEHAQLDSELSLDQRLYGANSNSLMHIISEMDDGFLSVMIVGHNPGFEDLVKVLSSKPERMTTATLAVMDLDIATWNNTEIGCCQTLEVLRPKEQPNWKRND